MVIGIILFTFALIAVLAYISFLFTGTYDQSVLSMDHAERVANRETVKNLLGLPGAHLARFMIDDYTIFAASNQAVFLFFMKFVTILLISFFCCHPFPDLRMN